jgi:virginiamycin B lyase
MRSIALGLIAPFALVPMLPPAPASAPVSPVEIREWVVPYEGSRPRDPYVDTRGRVWFVGQVGHYVAMLDPATGRFTKYDLDPGVGPHNLIVDDKGIVWYAGNRAAHIGRLDPRSKEIRKIPMPESGARDPHTLVFDPGGDIWFTVQGGGYVGKLTVATSAVQLVKIPGDGTRPYGIVVDPQGRPWFNLFGTNKIGTVDPKTMQLREYTLPHADARGRRLARTSDGGVWYVDYARGTLGRLDPAAGTVEEWANPSGSNSRPYAMAVDEQDRIWYVESGVVPNQLVGFDTKTKKVVSTTPIPSNNAARNTVRHRRQHHRAGSDRLVRQRAALLVTLGGCGLLVGAAHAAYDMRPPLAHTGGFGEETCRVCHFDGPELPREGAVTLGGVPERYRPGAVYRIEVTLVDSAARLGGFQLAARVAQGPHAGAQAGTLCATDARVAVQADTGSGVQYASHDGAAPADSLRWTLAWRAPAKDAGAVVFHVAANAANDDDSVFGDRIHRATSATRPDPGPGVASGGPESCR